MTYILNDKINPKPLKALYFKGAFDSEDGKTRQSWIHFLKELSWNIANLGGTGQYGFYANIPSGYNMMSWADVDNVAPIKCSHYTARSYGGTMWSNEGISVHLDVIYIRDTNFGSSSSDINLNGFVEFIRKNDVFIQYQLATPLTTNDSVITGESLLPLDSNMSNKIRQKVVDGLNEIDNSLSSRVMNADFGSNGYPYTSSGRALDETFYPVKPNTTYTINNMTANLTMLVWYNSKKVMINRDGITTPYTFTTGSNWAYIRFSSINGNAIDFSKTMLTESNHTYLHSQFNQKEHITNEQAKLLKDEEEKTNELPIYQYQNNKGVDDKGTVIDAPGYSVFENIVEENTSYYCDNYGYTNHIAVFFYNGSTYLGKLSRRQNGRFTTPSGCDWIRIEMYQQPAGILPNISKTGSIVHEANIAATILWENTSSSTTFASDDYPIADASNYAYLIIAFKPYSTAGITYIKVKNEIKSEVASLTYVSDVYLGRCFQIKSNTVVHFDHAYRSGVLNDERIIPVAIYGTNIL